MPDPDRPNTIRLDGNLIFILGNGPSLKSVNLAELSPYATIGMNAAYRYWDQISWRPTFYACLDEVVGNSHIEGIRSLIQEDAATGIQKYLLRQDLIGVLGSDADDRRVVNFDALRAKEHLFQVEPTTTGSHAALWARSLGFKKIVILGVDGRYKELVDGAVRRSEHVLEIESKALNPNYFFDGYQLPGDQYNVPNAVPGVHIDAWLRSAERLREYNAVVVSGNKKSEVRCFPFVDVDQLLSFGSIQLPQTRQTTRASGKKNTSPPYNQKQITVNWLIRMAFAKILKKPLVCIVGAMLFLLLALGLWSIAGHNISIYVLAILVSVLLLVQTFSYLFFVPKIVNVERLTEISLTAIKEEERQLRILRRDIEKLRIRKLTE